MTPRLNHELSTALRQQGAPLEVQDEQGTQAYVIVSRDEYARLVEGTFTAWLQAGLDQVTISKLVLAIRRG
jgi:hypothetical protein